MELTMAEVSHIRARRENWTRVGPVVTQLDESEIAAVEERATASIADPGPLGLWALATGSWIFGVTVAAFPQSTLTATIPILLLFAGVAQFIAGLYGFRRTNVLMATAFCSFGALYAVLGLFSAMDASNSLAGVADAPVIQGFLLVSFGFISLALAIAAMRTNAVLVAVFATLCVGFTLIGISHFAGAAEGWGVLSTIGGWFLCASAVFAYYAGMAMVVNSTWQRTAMPMGGQP